MMEYTDYTINGNFNGVLHFSAAYFGKDISEYLSAHPDRRIISIAPITRAPGYTEGYWVITEAKK